MEHMRRRGNMDGVTRKQVTENVIVIDELCHNTSSEVFRMIFFLGEVMRIDFWPGR